MKRVHIIGIGGIGISALARMYMSQGVAVSGSDTMKSRITRELSDLPSGGGAHIVIGEHRVENVPHGTELVIYTVAVPGENPELVAARERGITIRTYPEILGELSKDKYTIAVSGTHGKTTTTAMIADILINAGKDPTVIVGSMLGGRRSNYVAGESNILVVEACEYRRSFLKINPNILIITNIEEEHLDYYKDLGDIKSAFAELVAKIPSDGVLVCNPRDISAEHCRIVDYTKIIPPRLSIPGEHNKENARAALAVADELDIDSKVTSKTLENFKGTWRRFEYKGEMKTNDGGTAKVYDDYGHHPTAIKTTLTGARKFFGEAKIWCVFQPHLYSRTKQFLKEFGESFSDADEVIVADIYGAREDDTGEVNSRDLAKEIAKNGVNVRYGGDIAHCAKLLREGILGGNIAITMGAGDIFKVGEIVLS